MKRGITTWFFLLSILIPITVGFLRIRKLSFPFKLFNIWLTIWFLFDLLALNINDLSLKILLQYLSNFISIYLYIILVLLLKGLKVSPGKAILILLAVAIFFLSDYLLQYDVLIKARWGLLIGSLFCIFLSIPVIIDQFSNSFVKVYKNSALLILIGLFVSYLFFDIFIILMAFLYNENNNIFFLNLFSYKLFLDLLTYIAYSFAFLWATKKETYLLH